MAVKISVQEFQTLARKDETLRKEIEALKGKDKAELAASIVNVAADRGLSLSTEEVKAAIPSTPDELPEDQLDKVAGGRITNIRANASGLGGGGFTGTSILL